MDEIREDPETASFPLRASSVVVDAAEPSDGDPVSGQRVSSAQDSGLLETSSDGAVIRSEPLNNFVRRVRIAIDDGYTLDWHDLDRLSTELVRAMDERDRLREELKLLG